MKKSIVRAVVAVVVAGTGIGAYAVAGSGVAARADCPGVIVCPLTGEPVCGDRCPLHGESRDAPSASPCRSESEGAANPDTKPAVKEGCCR